MNSLTKLALKRPVSALLIVLALVVFGTTSVLGFRLELTPDMEMPMLFVMTVYQGGAPETTQELVTKVVEDAGKTLSGVNSIDSVSGANSSMVMFTYDYGTDLSEAYSDLRSALDTAQLTLPEDAMDPVIIEMNMNSQDMMTLSVTTTGDMDVLKFVHDEVEPQLERIPEIARVNISGGEEDYIRILLHQDKMKQYGVSMANIATYITAMDFTIPVGDIEQGSQAISAFATSKPESLVDLQNIPVITQRGSVIKLSDVATVSMASTDDGSISRYNGHDNISIGIAKTQSAGTVNVSRDVKKLMDRIASKNEAIDISVTYDAADSIISSLSSVGETLVLGVILSMVVLFIFFGDFKASLIVGSSMPISLFATLIFMSFAGFSLNVVTMGALVIAIGMMVDASIVVLESCFRQKDRLFDFKTAALEGAKIVGSSVVASTITTVVVYLPLALMKGLAGQIFSQLGYTIIIAMLSSLIVALTLIPIFFWKYRPVEKKTNIANKALSYVISGYRWLLEKIIMKKKTVMIVAVALLALAFYLAGQLNKELMATTGIDSMSISIEQRSGTRIDIVDQNIREIEQMVIDDPYIAGCNVSISGSTAKISAYPDEEMGKSVNELVEEYNQKLKDYTNMSIIVTAAGSGFSSYMSVGASTQISLESEDLDNLKLAARQVEQLMLDIPGVIKTNSDITSDASQAKVKLDALKCMDVGITPVQAAGEMYSAVSGKKAMDMNIGVDEYEVRIEYPRDAFNTAADLMNLEIATARGTMITVGDVAYLEYSDAPEALNRANGKYTVSVTAYTTEASKFTAQNAINEEIKNSQLPEGVEQTQSMMEEMMTDEFTAIFKAIFTAVFLIFLVMAMQFESPRFSLMVMLSIPFSMIGSFFLLFVTGSTLDMTALMGVLMLVGIVVNNGILYVDTANQLKATMPLKDALVESGCIRLRPILMTTLTTILSMVPMCFAKNENAAMMKGMSLIIIGGLITSTLLILLLLPSFYLIMNKDKNKDKKERKNKSKRNMKKLND